MRRFFAGVGFLLLAGSLLSLFAPMFHRKGSPEYFSTAAAMGDDAQPMIITNPVGADARGFYFAGIEPVVETMRPVIVIDPGHGGGDEGASGFDLKEKDIALHVALRLEHYLQEHHFMTILTRRSDVFVPLSDRARIANRFAHSIFVSIHFNQSQEISATGVEVYYANEKLVPDFIWCGTSILPVPAFYPDAGKPLAESIQRSMLGMLPVADRGVKGRSLYVTCNVRGPAVLVEGGFLSNPFDALQLKATGYRERLAASIADGIANYKQSPEEPASRFDFAKAKE